MLSWWEIHPTAAVPPLGGCAVHDCSMHTFADVTWVCQHWRLWVKYWEGCFSFISVPGQSWAVLDVSVPMGFVGTATLRHGDGACFCSCPGGIVCCGYCAPSACCAFVQPSASACSEHLGNPVFHFFFQQLSSGPEN